MTKILILSHGRFADSIKDTVEMISGSNPNIISLGIFPEQNINAYESKIRECVSKNADNEIIIMVDVLGGSPYNIAAKLLNEYPDLFLLTGVNIPMVLETVPLLDSTTSSELLQLMRNSANDGIKVFDSNGEISLSNIADRDESNYPDYTGDEIPYQGDGEIVMTRVDYRLLHGQVVTKWVPKIIPDTIIICDDYLYEDDVMVNIYRSAAPDGINVIVAPTDVVAYAYQHNTLPAGRIFLLFRNLDQLNNALSKGLKLKEIQLGGIPKDESNIMVQTAVSLSNEDIGILDGANNNGTKVYIQILPDDSPMNYTDIRSKVIEK